MERRFLLTFRKEIGGIPQYDWFETEEELRGFIKEERPYWVFDALKIDNAERLDLESEE